MKTSILIILALLTFSSINAQKAESKEPEKTEKQGIIIFKSLTYDFGTIDYDSEAVAIFVFKNMTKQSVKLTNVKTSCGCTGAEWPREEIAKKKKNKITVKYDSKRVGKFQKTVYVYVEGQENPIQLEIKGEVSPQGEQPTESKSIENSKESDNQSVGNVSGDKQGDIKSVSKSTGPSTMTKPVKKDIQSSPNNTGTVTKAKTE